MKRVTDNHSYSRPDEAVTTHLHWDAKVDFDQRQIHATATYDIQVASDAERLMLDCRDLTIHSVTVDGEDGRRPIGSRTALHWPTFVHSHHAPEQTGQRGLHDLSRCLSIPVVEGERPFLFTQSQAILARTWVPCQDSPGVRFTYSADVECRRISWP